MIVSGNADHWHDVTKLVAQKLFNQDYFPEQFVITKIKKQNKVTYINHSNQLVPQNTFYMFTTKLSKGIKEPNDDLSSYHMKRYTDYHDGMSNDSNLGYIVGGAEYKARKYKTKYVDLKKKKTRLMLF